MADIIVSHQANAPGNIPLTFKDMGDGTYALVVSAVSSGGGGGAATIADGADVTQGAIADAAVSTDTTGTISGKLRGLVKILASVWDSGAGKLKVTDANIDVALSTRLKAADTLTKVSTVDTITNVVHVDDNSGSLTVDATNLDVALSTRLKAADTLAAVTTLGTVTNVVHVDDNAGSLTVDATSLPLPTGAAQDATLTGGTMKTKLVDTGGTNVGSVSAAGALKVDNSAVTQPTQAVRSATATRSDVASSATSVTVLASNANRLGATIYNDSTQNVYLKFGTTAVSTDFTIMLYAAQYFEVPFGYTSRIDGIWVSANGNARVTELTA